MCTLEFDNDQNSKWILQVALKKKKKLNTETNESSSKRTKTPLSGTKEERRR